jgi:TusA-related sulfurtransferase
MYVKAKVGDEIVVVLYQEEIEEIIEVIAWAGQNDLNTLVEYEQLEDFRKKWEDVLR